MNEIYTIGHSTHTMEEFLKMLKSFDIQSLVDVRTLPGSNKYPQFNKENMGEVLPEENIDYTHFKELGGLRKVNKNSINTRWHNKSFQGFADYMETEDFEHAVEKLCARANKKTTVIMCAEAVWWRCHRSMISDNLKAKGWTVWHIMSEKKKQEHTFTSPARIVGDHVFYSDE